jgi:DNA-binding response OmpR family regulator
VHPRRKNRVPDDQIFSPHGENAIIRSHELTISRLQAEIDDLHAYSAALKGALAASKIQLPALNRGWATNLTQQEAAFMGALIRAYPRAMRHEDIIAVLPHHDHAKDHNPKLSSVLAHRVRKTLGFDAIETVHGLGFRVSDAFITAHGLEESPDRRRVA